MTRLYMYIQEYKVFKMIVSNIFNGEVTLFVNKFQVLGGTWWYLLGHNNVDA